MKKKIIKYSSIFLSGFLLMLTVNFYIDWQFEEEILDNLAIRIKSNCPDNTDSLVIRAMNIASYIENPNTEVFGDFQFNSIRTKLISPSFSTLSYGGGMCGSYTLFLARLLKKVGFGTKIIELHVNGRNGGHITLGIESGNKLLLIDPFYNHSFTDSVGHLSDIHDVAKNWSLYYSKHLPAGYKIEYNYQQGWRYTNWDKFGFISRSFYKLGSMILGKFKMDNLSVRYFLLGFNKFYCGLSFCGFLFFVFIAVAPYLKRKRFILYKPFSWTSVNVESTLFDKAKSL